MSGSIDWQVLSLQLVTTFAHFLWQGAVIGVMLAMVLRLCARRSPNTRYVTACVAFALLPVCVGGTFALVNNNGDAIFVTHSDAQNSIQASPQLNRNAEPPHLSQLVPLVTADEQSSAEPLNVTSQSVDAELAERFERRWSGLLSILSPYLFGVYLVGVAVLLLRFGVSIPSSGRLRRACRLIEDATIVQIIAEQAARMGLRRIPLVGLCHRVAVPIVVGILKPMILLPPAILCGLDPQQLAAILSHEMAHIRRYDMLVNLMQRIVEAVLFFHPITWWISRSISIERENCCDDMAVAGCGRLQFASALLAMAELCANSRGLNIISQLEALAADGGNASQLSTRIHRLLGEVQSPRLIPSRTALATLCIAVMICGSLSFAVVAQSREPVVQEESKLPAAKAVTETGVDSRDNNEREVVQSDIEVTTFDSSRGEVVFVDQSGLTCAMDIGSRDGLKVGLTFSVYKQRRKAADYIPAPKNFHGKIEIVRISGDHSAMARIVNQNPEDPVAQGDQIYSPLFQSGRKVRIAVIGRLDFDGHPGSDRDEFQRIIEHQGAEIILQVDDNAKILGKDSKELTIEDIKEQLTEEISILVVGHLGNANVAGVAQKEIYNRTQTIKREMLEAALVKGIAVYNLADFLDRLGYSTKPVVWSTAEKFPAAGGPRKVQKNGR